MTFFLKWLHTFGNNLMLPRYRGLFVASLTINMATSMTPHVSRNTSVLIQIRKPGTLA